MDQKDDFKYIVRIGNTDLDGNRKLASSLTRVKGISFMFANAVCNAANVDKLKKVGNLKEDEIKRINEVIKDPTSFKLPDWLFNRRNDLTDGGSKHLFSTDLVFNNDNDIKMLKKMKSYKGIRHILGLPARGQKTRSNFRKNKGKVNLGVQKKQVPRSESKEKNKK